MNVCDNFNQNRIYGCFDKTMTRFYNNERSQYPIIFHVYNVKIVELTLLEIDYKSPALLELNRHFYVH